MQSFDIYRRGELVGRLVDAVPDMWYLDGRLVAATSQAGTSFTESASALEIGTTYNDHTKAFRCLLKESPEDEGTLGVALSLSGDRLLVRRILEKDSQQWVLDNVPE